MGRLIESQDFYLLQMAKLFPVEVTAPYVIISLYAAEDHNRLAILAYSILGLVFVCFGIMFVQTRSFLQSFLTSVAFIVYALTIASLIYGDLNTSATWLCISALVGFFFPRLLSYLRAKGV